MSSKSELVCLIRVSATHENLHVKFLLSPNESMLLMRSEATIPTLHEARDHVSVDCIDILDIASLRILTHKRPTPNIANTCTLRPIGMLSLIRIGSGKTRVTKSKTTLAILAE